jgi:endoglucanase
MSEAVSINRALIKSLVEAWGPPGYEDEVRTLITDYVQPLADDIQTDVSGNLICRMGTRTTGGKRVMIAAHMDEIGMFVHRIDRDGYARFTASGGLFPSTLNGNRVRFANGVIGTISIDDPYDVTILPKVANCYIDFSTSTQGPAVVQVGDVATLWRDYAERGDRLIAKSMDDRIGCVVAIETMRKIKRGSSPHEVFFVFTTQEEVGTRGARTAAFGLEPDMAIALDVTSTGDVPKGEKSVIKLGAGVSIKARDVGHITPPWLKDLAIRRAEEASIPFQVEVAEIGSTDAMAIQVSLAGIPSIPISVPTRYVHTTSETVDIHDIQATIDLTTAILSNPIDRP